MKDFLAVTPFSVGCFLSALTSEFSGNRDGRIQGSGKCCTKIADFLREIEAVAILKDTKYHFTVP